MTREEHGKVWQDASKKMQAIEREPGTDPEDARIMRLLAMALMFVGNSYLTTFGK